MRLNEDCYGAKVADFTVTIGDTDFANFTVGSRITVNVNGRDTTRVVRDMPEDIGIVVKGYPIYYSDFEFIPTEDFDDWHKSDKFLGESKKMKEALHYAVYTRTRDDGNMPSWMDDSDRDDSFNVNSKRELYQYLDGMLQTNKDPNEMHTSVTGIDATNGGDYKSVDLSALPRKYKPLFESAIDYSSMFDKDTGTFNRGAFDAYKLSDDEFEDAMDDQTDLEECWQMLATMYEDIWDDATNDILNTKVFWREGFIKNSKGAMLGCVQLKSDGPVVLISTITDELKDAEFYNVLLHEMCHIASYYGYGSLDPDHEEGWKKFADNCNEKIEFLRDCPITATCDIDKFD